MRLALPVLLLLALVAHGSGLANGFVFDDHRFVVRNAALESISVSAALLDPATHTSDLDRDVYRPLRVLGHAFDLSRWGLDPFGFHLHSLLAHLLAVLLVHQLLLRLLDPRTALLGAGLLAVHPAGVEVVGWVSSRGDQYALIAGTGALLLTLTERSGRAAPLRLLAALALSCLAVLGKESAAVLPAVAALHVLLLQPQRRWLGVLALTSGVILALVLRQMALDGATPVQTPPHGGSAWSQVAWACSGLERLLEHLAWPDLLSVDPPQQDWRLAGPIIGQPRTWIGAGLLILPLALWRQAPRAAFLLGWAWLAWLPSGSLLVTLRTLVTDRAAYPMLAPIGAVLALPLCPRFRPDDRRSQFVLCALLLGLALLAARRTQDFVDDEALWRSVLNQHPNSVRAHLGLAAVLDDPIAQGPWLERAATLAQPGSKEQAVALARWGSHLLSVQAAPERASEVLALALSGLQRWAHLEGRAGSELEPTAASLAESLFALGRTSEAEAVLRAAASHSSRPAAFLLKWALLLRAAGQASDDAGMLLRAESVLAEAESAWPEDGLVRQVRSNW